MAAVPPPSSLVQLTVNVMRTLYEKFHEVALRRRINDTEALQQALTIYTFINETLENGERFLIEDRQGRLREVFFDRIGQEAPLASRLTLDEAVKKQRESLRWQKT